MSRSESGREAHASNHVRELAGLGQSVWVDNLSRHFLQSGELRALVEDDGVTGLTSNPIIFEKAINGGAGYAEDIARLAGEGMGAEAVMRELMLDDVGRAADLLRPVYAATQGNDGFASLEVSPALAQDTEATIVEARELWRRLGRPNAMIKVPATRAALPAIRQLIADGVNINVTLLFGLGRYQEVCEAWLAGLEERRQAGKPLRGVASVASFFLSRIDSELDPVLRAAGATQLAGEIAVANAKLAYAHFDSLRGSRRFQDLARGGAAVQRLLWASTGTKDPAYPDTKYVDALIGPDTVTTLPMETLAAWRDHGKPIRRLHDGLDAARAAIDELPRFGVNLEASVSALEEAGLRKFADAHESLLAALENKCAQMHKGEGREQ